MSNFHVAVPFDTKPTPDWPSGTQLIWKGVDGRFWDLTSAQSPVRVLQGVEGLGEPPVEKTKKKKARGHGASTSHVRVGVREIFLPVFASVEDSFYFTDLDQSFRSSFSFTEKGVLIVRSPNNGERIIDCTLKSVDDVFERDPHAGGWAKYGYTLEADQPFFMSGIEQVFEWVPKDTVPFFGSDGSAFHISDFGVAGSAVLPNEGDVEVWPSWRFDGQFFSVTTRLGGKTFTVRDGVPSGQFFTINTDPSDQRLWKSTGEEFTWRLATTQFVQIPPGGAPVEFDLYGSGKITCHYRELFRRAW